MFIFQWRWALEGSNVAYLLKQSKSEVNTHSLCCLEDENGEKEVNLWNDWQKFSNEYSVDVSDYLINCVYSFHI